MTRLLLLLVVCVPAWADLPVYLVHDREPPGGALSSALIWNGYPSKRWHPVELQVEKGLAAIRRRKKLPALRALEELRFIGRAHAREGAYRRFKHASPTWGYTAHRVAYLYGWRPAQWGLSPAAEPPHYVVADNHYSSMPVIAPGQSAAALGASYVRGWMNSAGHKRAMLWTTSRQVGMATGGRRGKAYLLFGGLTSAALARLDKVHPLYDKLAKAKTSRAARDLIDQIVAVGEGSSFIRLAPLLTCQFPDIRLEAVRGLEALAKKVPAAKGPLFALTEWGLEDGDKARSDAAMAALKNLTGADHATPQAWRRWWVKNGLAIAKKSMTEK